MNLFDVYPLFDINIVKGKGCRVWDDRGTEYLDLYGGHAVISIGHAHPHYVEAVSRQAGMLGFYSNSVVNLLQRQLAERLGKASGYEDYSLFLINSGAEANENALKLASFHNGRTRVVSFAKAFHGRTSLAVEATDNPKINAPINSNGHTTFLPMNDLCVTLFTRKRTGNDVLSFLLKACPHCTRAGFVFSDSFMAIRIRSSLLDCFANGYRAAVVELNRTLMEKILSERYFAAELRSAWKDKQVYLIPHTSFHEEKFIVRGDNSGVLNLPDDAQILY